MRFKQFYLTEASKEYNYIKLFVDKIKKVLKDFSENRSRYEKYEYDDGWYISLRDIINIENFPEYGILRKLSNGALFLSYGELDFSKNPVLKFNRKLKDGTIVEHKTKAFYSPTKNLIAIPFVDGDSNKTYINKLNEISSTLLHEFAHMLQNVSGKVLKGTVGFSEKQWFDDPNEREAILNQIYKEIQNILSNMITSMKEFRDMFNKTKDKKYYKSFLDNHNELVKAFKDIETFEKFLDSNLWKVKYNNSRIYDVILYFKKHYKEEFDDFLSNMYDDLEKEFKNVLPTKEIKAGVK